MAFLDRLTVDKWLAVVVAASKSGNGGSVEEALRELSRARGWPGRVAWMLYSDPEKMQLALAWLRAGVKPSREVLEEALKAAREAGLSRGRRGT